VGGNSISDDSAAHLETRDNLSCFGTVLAIYGNAIPEHLERLLKSVDRVNVRKRQRR
jgi:hypothetical protein